MFAVAPLRVRASQLSCVLALALAPSITSPREAPRLAQGSSVAPAEHESEDPHAEIKRLMGRVERRLGEIDKLLSDAGASQRGRDATRVDDESGTGVLVRQSQDASRSVVRDIDRILELANHAHPSGAA